MKRLFQLQSGGAGDGLLAPAFYRTHGSLPRQIRNAHFPTTLPLLRYPTRLSEAASWFASAPSFAACRANGRFRLRRSSVSLPHRAANASGYPLLRLFRQASVFCRLASTVHIAACPADTTVPSANPERTFPGRPFMVPSAPLFQRAYRRPLHGSPPLRLLPRAGPTPLQASPFLGLFAAPGSGRVRATPALSIWLACFGACVCYSRRRGPGATVLLPV